MQRPNDRGAASLPAPASGGVEEQAGVCYEQLGILELRSVPGIGIDDQLRIRDVLLQVEGIDRRHHDVVMAVNHQRRLTDLFKIGEALATWLGPFYDRCHLCLHGLGRGRRILVLTLVPAFPEGAARCLTRLGW